MFPVVLPRAGGEADDVRNMRRGPVLAAPEVQLETERLILRLPRIEDFERYRRDAGGREFAATSAARCSATMHGAASCRCRARGCCRGSRCSRWSRNPAGAGSARPGPWQPDGWPGTEVGYFLPSGCPRQGLRDRGLRGGDGLGVRRAGLDRGDPFHRPRPTPPRRPSRSGWGRAIADRAGCRRRSTRIPSTSGARRARNGSRAARRQRHDHRLRFLALGQLPQGAPAAGAARAATTAGSRSAATTVPRARRNSWRRIPTARCR